MLEKPDFENLYYETEPLCTGDTSDLWDWMQNGNELGYLDGRSNRDIADEWNEYTEQATGQ
jgi:hypothetical protein